MKTSRDHVQLNVGDAARSLPFDGGLFDYFESRPGYYAVFFEDPDRLKLEGASVPEITARRPAPGRP